MTDYPSYPDIVKHLRDWSSDFIDRNPLLDAAADEIERLRGVAQEASNCDCGFSADVCKTNPCMRKKMATSGLNPDAKYPYCGSPGSAQGVPEPLSLQAVREDERLACWKIADKERTALKNADPTKAAWLVAFDIANAIKARSYALPSTDPRCTCAAIVNPDIPHARFCPLSSTSRDSASTYCALCDHEHQLHEDAQGFHHVVKGARVACPFPTESK